MSKTLTGLVQAFIGESQARNRYNIYANIARNEGYEQISEIFNVTAENERVHAKNFWRAAQSVMKQTGKPLPEITVDALAPLKVGTTADNLKAAIEGETYEHTQMYPEIANTAEKEGYKAIAKQVRAIAQVEAHHADRYTALLKEVEANTVFKKKKPTIWICRECGYLHTGDEPPEQCPSCFHARKFFQVLCETY
ncbi:MAG: rubrerythrin [Promethearchaeota archaeon]